LFVSSRALGLLFTIIIGVGATPVDEISVTATVYHAVEGQTDDTPLITASGKHIDPSSPESHRWIAVSRDLEKLGFVFGAKVIVECAGEMNGTWIVQDRMNRRWTHRIDFLVNENKMGKWENVTIKLNTPKYNP